MADKPPRRMRGPQHRESGYRLGFADGYTYGRQDAAAERARQQVQDDRVRAGLAKLTQTVEATTPRRTAKRTRTEAEGGSDPGCPDHG